MCNAAAAAHQLSMSGANRKFLQVTMRCSGSSSSTMAPLSPRESRSYWTASCAKTSLSYNEITTIYITHTAYIILLCLYIMYILCVYIYIHTVYIILLLCQNPVNTGNLYSKSSSPLLLRGFPDTARILCWSFTPKRHGQLRARDLPKVLTWWLEHDSNP